MTFGSPEGVKTPSGRAATQFVMTEFFNRRHQQLLEHLADGIRNPDVEDSGMVTTATTRLTADQMNDLTTRITAIIDEFVDTYRDQTGDGVHNVTIRADVFALPGQGH